MGKLVFRVASDWQEVVRLRTEIEKLKQTLLSMNSNQSPDTFKKLNAQLGDSSKKLDELITEAAKAGAVMEGDFKKKIFDASQTINGFTEKIITQKNTIKGFEQDLRALQEEYRKLTKNGGKSQDGLERIHRMKNIIAEEKDALFNLTQQQANARLSVNKLRQEYSLYKDDSTKLISANHDIARSMKEFILTIAGANAIKSFISDVVEVTGNFQKMEAVLANSLGSNTKAKEAIDMLADFGARTPFQIDELTAAYVKLTNQGFTPTMNQMKKLGDLASSTGKSFDQLAEAIIDAQVGENERLKEFGIRASKNGDKVIYTFKEQETTVENTASAIREYILSLGDLEGVVGANEKISSTFVGRLSNIQDELTNQFKNFGDSFNSELSGGISAAALLIENLNAIIPIIGGLVAAYGAYKAAVIAVAAAHKAGALFENIRLIGMMRKELGLATAAQQAFNVASKANIYVALISVLIGLGTAVYMFTKRANEAINANKSLNRVSEKASEEYAKQASKIDRLNGVLKSETASLDLKKEKLKELKGIIPEYNAKLDEEGRLINNNTEAIKAYLTQLEKQIKLKAAQEELEELYRKKRLQEKELKSAEEVRDKMAPSYPRGGMTSVYQAGNGVDGWSQYDKLDLKVKTVNKGLSETLVGISAIEKEIEQTSISISQGEQTAETKNKKHWEKQKKEAETALDAIASSQKKLMDAGKFDGIDEAIVKSYKDNIKKLKEAEKELKVYDTSSKQESDAEKQRKKQEKSAEGLLSLRRQNQQDEINLMKDGSDKKLKQIELDYQKELDVIRKKEQEWSKANGGKLTAEQSVQISLSYSQAEGKRDKSISEMNKEELEAMNRYLKEYGTFQQRKDAITKEYSDKIAKATTEGDKKVLQKEMEESLSSLNMEKLKQEINWELIFGDLSKASKKSLNDVKQQLKAFKDSDEYKNMGVDQKKVIDEALNNIQDTIIDKGGLLGDLPEQLDTLRIAQEELNKAQEEYNNAIKNGTDAEKEAALKKKNNAEKNVQNAQVNVTKSADKTSQNLITLASVITQLGGSSEISLSQIGSLATELIDIFTEAGSKIGGIVGAAFSLLDAINKQGLDGFVENIFSSVFKASASIWDTITFGAFSKITGSGDSDRNLEQDIEYLTQSNQDLKNVIDNLAEKMDDASVLDSTELYNQQKANLNEKMYNTQEMMRRSGEAYSNGFIGIGGSHSSNKKINDAMSSDDWGRISKIVGTTVNGAGDFWRLTNEQMAMVATEATDLYSKIKNAADDGYKNAAQYMDSYIGYYKELEELQNRYYEKLTSTSFDSVKDNFRSSLLEMKDNAEAFTENFKEMMQNTLLEIMMTDVYDKQLQQWYNNFAKSVESGGELTPAEIEASKREYMDIVEKAKVEWEKFQEIIGYDASSSQSSTQKGFAAASQDSIEELNGRFTALQIAGEEIKNQSTIQTGLLSSINDKMSLLDLSNEDIPQLTDSTPNIAGQTREIITNSYQPQVNVVFPDAKLDVLTVEVSTMKNIVNEMRTLQVEGNLDTQEIREGIQIISKNSPRVLANMDEMKRDIKNVL